MAWKYGNGDLNPHSKHQLNVTSQSPINHEEENEKELKIKNQNGVEKIRDWSGNKLK